MKRLLRRISAREASALGFCAFVALVCLAVCSKSSPLYPLNDWTDANVYLSVGKGMLQGRVVYRDLYDHKGPLLYALHALCAWACPGSFLAVFWMEVACATCFLYSIYRLLRAYGAPRAALLALPVLAALVYSSVAFEQGDSAEELCLPMLGGSLCSLMLCLRDETKPKGERVSARALVGNGILFGCVLWVKFTFLGFYAGWLLLVLVWRLRDRGFRAALCALGWFALGAALATLPWLIYFGWNGALGAWFKTYLYDNIFLYSGGEGGGGAAAMLKGFGKALWAGVAGNLRWTLPTLAGMALCTLRGVAMGARERAALWCMAALTALGVYIGGRSYPYYALILAAFVGVGFMPLCRLVEAWLAKKRASAHAVALMAAALVALSGALCCLCSPNADELGLPRETTMQYRLAAQAERTPETTLLNYGFSDAGFYTAFEIAPTVKYFHRANVPLQEMLTEQERYLREGVTDYVVARAPLSGDLGARYALVASADAPPDFWYETVYLYRRKGEETAE